LVNYKDSWLKAQAKAVSAVVPPNSGWLMCSRHRDAAEIELAKHEDIERVDVINLSPARDLRTPLADTQAIDGSAWEANIQATEVWGWFAWGGYPGWTSEPVIHSPGLTGRLRL
jgi:hypothetical protein